MQKCGDKAILNFCLWELYPSLYMMAKTDLVVQKIQLVSQLTKHFMSALDVNN
jgi:hypothetical protein